LEVSIKNVIISPVRKGLCSDDQVVHQCLKVRNNLDIHTDCPFYNKVNVNKDQKPKYNTA